ncbi:MAG: dihydroorotate dehydrogenase electron transfer subunit [Coriobacteriia bacterium]|nr:dihydroorotate dehydrogenase electron transfer subunit [Coriobacteriia bacterium]
MLKGSLEITQKRELAPDVYELHLCGPAAEAITKPGQFMNIQIEGKYLRRPISIADKFADELTIVFKTVGEGTKILSKMDKGEKLDVLSGLGNGYDIEKSSNTPYIVGGGLGIPPLVLLAKKLVKAGIKPNVILGFNNRDEIFYEEMFRGCDVKITTMDGSSGIKGFVTDTINRDEYAFACGPEPMLKAVHSKVTKGQFSFEERMGCGFGACMGCSCKTITGYKRICKEGPILEHEEILW